MPKRIIEYAKPAVVEIECEYCHFILDTNLMESQPICIEFPYGHYLDSCIGLAGDYSYFCSDKCVANFFNDLVKNNNGGYQAKLQA